MQDIVIPSGVTEIGSSTFSGCTNLRSVTFQGEITTIGSSAFKNCSSLTAIEIQDSVAKIQSSAFEGCSSLQSIHLPDGLTELGSSCFKGCSSLTTVKLPDRITSIASSTFCDCTHLQTIELPANLESIGSSAFSGCAALQEVNFNCALEEIPSECFKDCVSLQTVNFSGGVQSIGNSAFENCDSLTSIDFIDGATSINAYAFANCDGLREIRIPGSVTDVKYSVFRGCTNLESVTLEAGSEPLCFVYGYDCFGYCPIRSATIARNYQVKDGYSLFDRTYSDENYLTSVTITDDVTAIPENAFSDCAKLNSVRIGKNVTSIGAHAFSGCGIEEIQLPDGITEIAEGLFKGCDKLSAIIIPEQVTSIGVDAFSGCDKLSAVNIPEQVTSIGSGAFSGCAFTDIQLPSELMEIPEKAFYDCDKLELIDIPSQVSSIGKSAFYNCDMLWRVNLPDGLKEIGDSAFESCYKLDKINLPGGLTSIGDSAFEYCDTLKSLNLPAALTHIGKYAFSDCGVASFDVPSGIAEIPEGAFASSYLTSIRLPATLTSIGTKAFQGSGLRSIEIPGSVTSIGSQAFDNSRLESVEIPEGVISIGSRAFADSDLRSVSFSRSMTAIETYLFAGCNYLTSITVPGYISEVRNYAFQGCENLTDVVLEEGVTKLGDGAFMDCGKLRMVKLPESLTDIARYPFENCGNLTAFVTAGSEAESYCKQNNIPYSTGSVGTIEFTGVKDGDAIPGSEDYTLNWKAVSGANAYRVEWLVGNQYESGTNWYWDNEKTDTVTSPSFTFTEHYGSGWVYLVSVAAYRQSGSGSVLLADGSITLHPDWNMNSITFPSSLRLGVGESATVTASSSRDSKFTYESSKPKIATISSGGKVTALKAGTATLTARGKSSGKSASCVLTVYPVPTKVSLSPSKLSIGVGQTSQLAATVTPEGAEYELSYESSDEGIARVDDDGLVTGVDTGTATVTVKTGNGKSASCTVTVKPAPDSVRFDPEELAITVGHGAALKPILEPENSAASFTYESDDDTVVIVDESGNLEAVGVGEATVTATAQNGKQGSVTVRALAAPEKIDGVPEEIALGAGEKLTLKPSAGENTDISFSYASSKTAVATVNAAGKITARKAGEAVVTVTPDAGEPVKCNVTVFNAPSKLTLSAKKATLGVGDELQLTATLPNNSASAISFSANDKGKFVTVGEDGKITAAAPGTATVTAKTFNGKTASCKIIVKPAPDSVRFDPDRLTITEGRTAALNPVLSPMNSAASFTYESDAEAIATVDESGNLEAVSVGLANITATAQNGAKGTIAVEVMAAPTEIGDVPAELELGVGEKLALKPSAGENADVTFSYASSKAAVATVNAAGKITARKAGEADITVTADTGISAKCRVTVRNAPSKLTLSATKAALGVGDKLQLIATLPNNSASAITFSSSDKDEKVVILGESGLITAVAPGAATITAKTFNGKKATCKVTVKAAPDSVSLGRDTLKLAEDQSFQLKPELCEGSAASFTYESSASGIAAVDEDGTVTAVTPGSADITVTTYNGESDTCRVTVVPAPTSLSIADITLGKGEKLALAPVVDSGADSDVSPFTYSVKKATIAKLTTDGRRITGKAAGTTKLTVKTYNGLTADCEVTVTATPKSVSLSLKGATMSPGCKLLLDALLSGDTSSNLRYESDNLAVATVEEDGTVTAVARGIATITVQTYNGKKASFTLTVE